MALPWEVCPRCSELLIRRDEHQFCVPCNFWWSWTGSRWMGKPGESPQIFFGTKPTSEVPYK